MNSSAPLSFTALQKRGWTNGFFKANQQLWQERCSSSKSTCDKPLNGKVLWQNNAESNGSGAAKSSKEWGQKIALKGWNFGLELQV